MGPRPLVDERNQREEFGGFNFGAAFYGWLVATGVAALLTALLTAIGGAVAFTTGTQALSGNSGTVGLVSGILLLVDVAIAYYIGGYVAGRLARFDGARQGFGVWLMGLAITIVLAIVGL